MEDSHFVHQRLNARYQANPTNKGKPCSHFLLKFLLICVFLSLLPLFPTEPPAFISNTIFARAWELIHLLIIGILLSYGLFCRVKSPQVSPKPQIAQPYAANILRHTSLFDYQNENPSGNFENNAIPTKSCNFSYYRTEPYVVVRRENCGNFDERPLGLPVRSLRSRILESDCSDSDGNEECDSECESDFSANSSSNNSGGIPRSGKDQNLEGNVGNLSPIAWKSRPMGMDFMAEDSKFGMNQLNSQSFRSPMQGLYQKNHGFCSWLPESPNMEQQHPVRVPPMVGLPNMEGGSSWMRENFEMPVSGFSTQVCGSNVMGIPPNLEKGNLGWEEGRFYMPSAEAPSSMTAPINDYGSMSRYSHERVHLGEPSILENGNLGGDITGFFMPSAATPPSFSGPERNFASSIRPSRSRKFNNEVGDLGISSNFEHGNLGSEKNSLFMPSAVNAPSVSVADSDFTSSVLKPSRSRKFSNEIGDLGISPKLETGNLGGQKTGAFIPPSAEPSSSSAPEKDVSSSVKPSRSRKFGHENGDLGKSPNFEIGNLGGEKTRSFVSPAADPSSLLATEKYISSSIKQSRSRKFGHENGDLGKSPNFEIGNLVGDQTRSFVPPAADPSSLLATEKNISSSIKEPRSRKFGHENGDLGKSANLETRDMGGEKTSSFMPSSTVDPSSNSAHGKGLAFSVRRSRSRKFNIESGDPGKSTNMENVNLGTEQANSFVPSAVDAPSDKGFAPAKPQGIHPRTSPKKDEQGLKEDNVRNSREGSDCLSPHEVDSLSVPTPRDDIGSSINGSSLKKDEQRSMPTRWDDDCFVIPSSENDDIGNVEQENLPHGLACSSEPPSSAGSSSRRSSIELESPQSEEVGNVSASALTNNLEIEELGKENDNYKPSTPSPPPRIQTRKNDHFPSSVESSSNALAIGSLLDNDDDDGDNDEVGSPPTPERGKALSRTSHSRRFSCVAFFDRDQRRRGFKDDHAKEANKKISRGGKSCGWDCLKLDVKPSFTKAALKGKSVRTIRPLETPLDSRGEPRGEEKREEKGERKGEKGEMVVIQIGISEKKPNPCSNGGISDQKQGNGTTSIIVGLNSKESCKDKTADIKDEETDSEEIDRKAAEFIAKFKEQIRLQKVAATARAESSSSRQQQTRRNSLRGN